MLFVFNVCFGCLGGAFVYVMCGSWDASSTQRRESRERRYQLSYTHAAKKLNLSCTTQCKTIV